LNYFFFFGQTARSCKDLRSEGRLPLPSKDGFRLKRRVTLVIYSLFLVISLDRNGTFLHQEGRSPNLRRPTNGICKVGAWSFCFFGQADSFRKQGLHGFAIFFMWPRIAHLPELTYTFLLSPPQRRSLASKRRRSLVSSLCRI